MNNENTAKLFERFKFFHPERPLTEALMAFGFECGDGWFDLIWKLCEDIEKMLPTMVSIPEEPFEVVQVKEKFGGLRFYVTNANSEILDRISKAEAESYKTCEVCGAPGQPNNAGWITTLCEKCRVKK